MAGCGRRGGVSSAPHVWFEATACDSNRFIASYEDELMRKKGMDVEKLLPLVALDKVAASRCGQGMDEQKAVEIARRVFIQLYRGSIEHARLALEDGWREHIGDTGPLPDGPGLLAMPLSRIMASASCGHSQSLRILNMLDGAGIRTVKDLLGTSQAELLLIPNLGHVSVLHLKKLCVELRQRVG